MGKGTSKLEILAQQNELLKEQNDLLREQNELLRQSSSRAISSEREIFIDNINCDEMRNGFLVTSHRKKLWNVQIGLIKEFARICKKYNLRWFAIAGTLLGAVRHKGFIPWDDDVDIAMLRPDFEKFKLVAVKEIQRPYYFDLWYNCRRESDEPSDLTDFSLPLISREHFKKYYPYGYPFFPIIKIRDERTFMIEFPRENFNQGIWIDIFPLDSLPPFSNNQQKINFEIERIIYIATVNPQIIKNAMEKRQNLIFKYDVLKKFIGLPYKQRGIYLENFLAKNFFMSEHIGNIREWCIVQNRKFYQSKDFLDITYLPFETIELPVPIGYESILTNRYGDWRKLVKYNPHVVDYSADIPWKRYFQNN